MADFQIEFLLLASRITCFITKYHDQHRGLRKLIFRKRSSCTPPYAISPLYFFFPLISDVNRISLVRDPHVGADLGSFSCSADA